MHYPNNEAKDFFSDFLYYSEFLTIPKLINYLSNA
jgi:hypothetical protein